jgi:hypothetical protein
MLVREGLPQTVSKPEDWFAEVPFGVRLLKFQIGRRGCSPDTGIGYIGIRKEARAKTITCAKLGGNTEMLYRPFVP